MEESKIEKKEKVTENEIDSSSEDEDEESLYRNSELTQCRFYRNKLPAEAELVFVEIDKMESAGAYVTLPEYNNHEGFLLYSEVSKQRIRSVKKFISVGKKEIMEVRRVDEKSQSVDVTRKSVKEGEAEVAMTRFKNSKKVHAIMKACAVQLKTPVEELYEEWGWDLYDKFEHALDAFRIVVQSPEQVFDSNPKIDISEAHRACLISQIEKKIKVKPSKIRADFRLTSTCIEGVDLIKKAMLTAKHQVNVDGWNVDFKMIAPPEYKVEVTTLKRAEGIKKLQEALEIIKGVMLAKKEKFKELMAPHVIGNSQDPDVGDLIEEMKRKELEEIESGESEDNEDRMASLESDT